MFDKGGFNMADRKNKMGDFRYKETPSLGWRITSSTKIRIISLLRKNAELCLYLQDNYPVNTLFTKNNDDNIFSSRILTQYITIQMLPTLAELLDVSLSFLLTGHDIGEPGCLRVPSEEGRRFHQKTLTVSVEKNRLLQQILKFYIHSVPSAPAPFSLSSVEMRKRWENIWTQIEKSYTFPELTSKDSTDYYNMPYDIGFNYLTQSAKASGTCFNQKRRYHHAALKSSLMQQNSVNINNLICCFDSAGLPVNMIFQWELPALYSQNPAADALTDLFLRASSEGKDMAWALIDEGSCFA